MMNSWASEQANSIAHKKLILDLAEKNYEKALSMSTGTQSASDRSAKPALVGSTPTSCSKDLLLEALRAFDFKKDKPLSADHVWLNDWLKRVNDFCESPRVGTAEINQQGNVQDAGVPKAKPAGRV